jgi:hypothetical protein
MKSLIPHLEVVLPCLLEHKEIDEEQLHYFLEKFPKGFRESFKSIVRSKVVEDNWIHIDGTSFPTYKFFMKYGGYGITIELMIGQGSCICMNVNDEDYDPIKSFDFDSLVESPYHITLKEIRKNLITFEDDTNFDFCSKLVITINNEAYTNLAYYVGEKMARLEVLDTISQKLTIKEK